MTLFRWASLVAVLFLVAAIAFRGGVVWHESRILTLQENDPGPELVSHDPYPDVTGRFRRFRSGAPTQEVDPEAMAQLEAVGYLGGYVEATGSSGVVVHDSSRTSDGLNAYISGHAPEAYLMDMDGNLLHRWHYAFKDLWPDDGSTEEWTNHWRRLHLFENGDVLAIFEPFGIFKLDKDSNLLWENHCRAHHDMEVMEDGTIFVLTQRIGPLFWFTDVGAVIEDYITELAPDGTIRREVSLMECFRDSKFAALLEAAMPAGDVFHTNALKYLDGSLEHLSPAFKRGNFLVSVRELDVVAVVDIDAGEVVWITSGMWHRQHEPTLLDDGHLLLFDNLGNGGKSKVIETDPFTQEVIWTYGLTEGQEIFSDTCGLAQRLPNGNTLITEANNGRVIEVTPAGEVVWEYLNPHRAGDENQLIATMLDMVRLPSSFTPAWLDPQTVEAGGGE